MWAMGNTKTQENNSYLHNNVANVIIHVSISCSNEWRVEMTAYGSMFMQGRTDKLDMMYRLMFI